MAVIIRLPIKMPRWCCECPFARHPDNMHIYCDWSPESGLIGNAENRPGWCPLAEVEREDG
jgi:hypothetical protein